MKSSQILREAARLVEDWNGGYGCIAIADILWGDSYEYLGVAGIPEAIISRLELVRPSRLNKGGGYWAWEETGPRIIGLCLAAAIAESEGD